MALHVYGIESRLTMRVSPREDDHLGSRQRGLHCLASRHLSPFLGGGKLAIEDGKTFELLHRPLSERSLGLLQGYLAHKQTAPPRAAIGP